MKKLITIIILFSFSIVFAEEKFIDSFEGLQSVKKDGIMVISEKPIKTKQEPTQKIYKAPKGCLLAVKDTNFYSKRNYMYFEGQVINISGRQLNNVIAMVSFFDGSGKFVTSDTALIEYNPILPEQVSPFKVMAQNKYNAKSASVDFKLLSGMPLMSCKIIFR